MIEFFKEGGWGMWPILVLGLVTLGASIRFASKPDARQVGFLGAMGLATFISIVHATWTDFGAVFNAVSDEKIVPEAQMTRILFEGLKECTRPGALGGALLVFASILFAVGVLRLGRVESA
jgi:hypothetical protein